jgi:hypothetical protein
MKCYIHSDREAVAICVSCAKPICSECSLVLPDNKMHCKQCLINGNASLYKKSSWAWWLLPTFGGIIGGLIAFIANAKKSNRLNYVKGGEYLFVGLLITLIIAAIGSFTYISWDSKYQEGYNYGHRSGYNSGLLDGKKSVTTPALPLTPSITSPFKITPKTP